MKDKRVKIEEAQDRNVEIENSMRRLQKGKRQKKKKVSLQRVCIYKFYIGNVKYRITTYQNARIRKRVMPSLNMSMVGFMVFPLNVSTRQHVVGK